MVFDVASSYCMPYNTGVRMLVNCTVHRIKESKIEESNRNFSPPVDSSVCV
jgi:hypothetical protein